MDRRYDHWTACHGADGAVRIHTLKKENEETQVHLERKCSRIAKRSSACMWLPTVYRGRPEPEASGETGIVDYLEEVLGEDRSLDATKEGVLTHLDGSRRPPDR
ncbi:MAG: hypothetical protein ACLRMZ_27550 [Blautia marasmi]